MFITNTDFRSPISDLLSGPTEQHWLAAELALHMPWFLVTIREIDSSDQEDELVIKRTVLAAYVTDVERLAQQEADGLPQFESALIITPDRLNGTNTWKMEPLAAVWVAEAPLAPGQVVEICETQSGVKYVTSLCATPLNELRNHTLRYHFSAQEFAG